MYIKHTANEAKVPIESLDFELIQMSHRHESDAVRHI